MVRVVKADRRELKRFDVAGASVRTSDPIIGEGECLSAGFTEYTATSRLEWTFDYNEVFFMLRGSLDGAVILSRSIYSEGSDRIVFEFDGGAISVRRAKPADLLFWW